MVMYELVIVLTIILEYELHIHILLASMHSIIIYYTSS